MLTISVDDAHQILGSVVRRALLDVKHGSPAQKADATDFLNWICPSWRQAKILRFSTRHLPPRQRQKKN